MADVPFVTTCHIAAARPTEDEVQRIAEEVGPRARAWLGDPVGKVGAQVWTVPADSAAQVLAQLVAARVLAHADRDVMLTEISAAAWVTILLWSEDGQVWDWDGNVLA